MTQGYPHSEVSYNLTEHPNASAFERHCHNIYEILFVLQGEGSYIVEGTQYPLRANTLMIFRPQEYHYVRPSENSTYERYVIYFDATVPIDNAARLPFLNCESLNTHGVYFSAERLSKRLLPVFRMINGLPSFSGRASKDLPLEETLIRTVVTQILLLLSLEDTAEEEATGNQTVNKIVEALHTRLGEPLSLDQLAQEFFVSKYHLCRIFRQYTGVPLMTYISTKRIARAQQLLEQGVSATEAAELTGFQDYSSFYRAFRKQTGHAPKAKLKK